jgi:hypothetical protein
MLDPPEARALVLDQDGLRVALVSLDLVIVRPNLREELQELAGAFNLDTSRAAFPRVSPPGASIPGALGISFARPFGPSSWRSRT